MDDKLLTVIYKLTDQTRAGKVVWSDQSSVSLGDQFHATFGDVLVEVQKGDTRRERDDGEEYWVEYCRVQVRNNRGFVVASTQAEVGEHLYGRLTELHDVALASARNKVGVLEKLLQKLGA
jgi:aminoglycoside phosphotransferase (APT) family kinase protein